MASVFGFWLTPWILLSINPLKKCAIQTHSKCLVDRREDEGATAGVWEPDQGLAPPTCWSQRSSDPVEVFVEISSRFGNVWLQVDDFQRFFRDVCFVMSCYFLLVWSSVSSSILLPIRLYFGSGCYSWHSEIARASYLQIVRSLVPQFDDYCGYVRCWGPMAAITDHWTTCYNSGYMIYYKLEDNPRWLPSSSEDGHLWKTLKYIYIYILNIYWNTIFWGYEHP